MLGFVSKRRSRLLPIALFLLPAVVTDAGDPAREILDAAGVRGGLVVHLGCGDGRLTASLLADDSYLVQGLDTDAVNVAAARKHVHSLGLYGKVSCDTFDGVRLPYADNLVNLIVVERPGALMPEIMRVLAPEGVAYVKRDGRWNRTVKPRPASIDQWTHYLYDASNNAVAKDTVVGPPRRYQWIAPPQWARSHDHLSSVSAMVSAGGRIFYIVDEGPTAVVAIQPKWFLVARDAFSGVLLWKRPVGPWEGHLRGFRSGPSNLARRLVALEDRVYVTLGYGKPVCALNAATGETVRTYGQTAGTLEIILHEGTLFAVIGDRVPDNTAGAARPEDPQKIWHWWPIQEETPPLKHLAAIEPDSGKLLWTKNDADTHQSMPTTLAAAGGRLFYQNHQEVLALDAASGHVDWRADRPVSRRRPSWSAPTLVVSGDILICGDRAIDAVPPEAPETDKPSQWLVDSRGGISPKGRMTAFSTATGEQLWTGDCRESYNSPPDVLVADGLVWSGNLVSAREPGITAARDLLTGRVERTRPNDQQFFRIVMSHHRCYRNKATEKYLVLGRDGTELIDLATGKGYGNHWVRGSCQYGVMPCNGLIYAPPHACACHVESKLNSFNALAPAAEPSARPEPAERLVHGPAFGIVGGEAADTTGAGDWPTHRHDAMRSGNGSCSMPGEIERLWQADVPGGRVSSPVVAGGKLFVAAVDAHTVHAIDAADGTPLWSFTAGGRIDSPPTVARGAAVFGCADGWIYCLDAADGQLAWRFRPVEQERRIVANGQVESAWPLHGSVLVRAGEVYAVAGRTGFLDGGMVLCRVDLKSGRAISETPITGPALPDVLSSDGVSVFMRHRRFDTRGVAQTANVPHLYSPAGFLDGSWWHRTYWMVGTTMRSGWGAWPNSAMQVPAGRLLVHDGSTVYGFGRFNQYHRNGSHVGLGSMKYLLYASGQMPNLGPEPSAPPDSGRAKRRAAPPNQVGSRWAKRLPILARAMVLCGETLFVAGPPDVVPPTADGTHPYTISSQDALREQDAALAGERGALLLAAATGDGEQRARYELESAPVFDGMAAAAGRLFISTVNGKIVCYGAK